MTTIDHTALICQFMLANIQNLRHAFKNVGQIERDGKVWPMFFEENSQNGKSALEDSLRNCVYFRQTGAESYREFEDTNAFYQAVTPMRLVAHFRNERGGNNAIEYLNGFRTLLMGYQLTNSDYIDITGGDFDAMRVFESETQNVPYKLPNDSVLISIDFNLNTKIFGQNCMPDIFCANHDLILQNNEL